MPAATDPERTVSMSMLTQQWRAALQPIHQLTPRQDFPLDLPDLLDRSDTNVEDGNIPWESLLAADLEDGPILSLQRTEDQFRARLDAESVRIDRVWDVDSFFGRVTSLAAFKGGFRLGYQPPFLRRITQNPRVLFAGHKIHKLKQLRLGSGVLAAGAGYDCHVFFPSMDVPAETHLTASQQELWIDRIVLPALRASCPADILQHHPRSFQEVSRKAGVGSEAFLHRQHTVIDIQYSIPERYLAAVSDMMRTICDNDPALFAYKNFFFVVSAHDLKLLTKRSTLGQCQADFLDHLTQRFHFNPTIFPSVDCWVDVGYEDTPSGVTGSAVTLLRKRPCTSAWSKIFNCPHSRANHLKQDTYPWAATAMATSVTATMMERNSLVSAMAHNKAYNLHKDIFSTPLKNYSPFDNPQLEGLSYSQDVLADWAKANSRYGSVLGLQREKIVQTLVTTKCRVAAALTASAKTNFGARAEFRINISVFERLTTDTDVLFHSGEFPITWPPSTPPPSHEHTPKSPQDDLNCKSPQDDLDRQSPQHDSDPESASSITTSASVHLPYWVIPTEVVNAFSAAQINRWLLYLEVVAARITRGRNNQAAADRERQLLDGPLVSIVLRMLHLSMSKVIPERNPAYWKNTFLVRLDVTRSKRYSGLNLRQIWASQGLAFLPFDLIHWNPMTLTHRATRRLKFAQNAYGAPFHKQKQGLHHKLSQGNSELEFFRSLLQQVQAEANSEHYLTNRVDRRARNAPYAFDVSKITERNEGYLSDTEVSEHVDLTSSPYEVLRVGAELVVQHYIADVWQTLHRRHQADRRVNGFVQSFDDFLQPLRAEEAAGLEGLSLSMIAKLCGENPRVVEARLTGPEGRSRGGQAWFPQFASQRWHDRLTVLFNLDDETGNKKRSWNEYSYRRYLRHLHNIVKAELGVHYGIRFLHTVWACATHHLWTVPQFDIDHFAVMYKPSKHHSEQTREAVKDLTQLQRTNWLTFTFGDSYLKTVKTVQSVKGLMPLTADQESARTKLRWAKKMSSVPIYTQSPRASKFISDPTLIGCKLFLYRAAAFQTQLEDFLSYENSTSETSTEEEEENLV